MEEDPKKPTNNQTSEQLERVSEYMRTNVVQPAIEEAIKTRKFDVSTDDVKAAVMDLLDSPEVAEKIERIYEGNAESRASLLQAERDRHITTVNNSESDLGVAMRRLESNQLWSTGKDMKDGAEFQLAHESIATHEAIRDFQSIGDVLAILNASAHRGSGEAERILHPSVERTRTYARYVQMRTSLRDAMNSSTAGDGLEFIPENWSARLIEQIYIHARLPNLHPEIVLPPGGDFKMPVDGALPIVYIAGEPVLTDSPPIRESNPATSNITFSAKTFAIRTMTSDNFIEDSIIPVMDFIRGRFATAMVDTMDDVYINGDTADTHQDTVVTASDDTRRAFMGYRATAFDHTAGTNRFDDGEGHISLNKIRKVRMGMGKYGQDPSKVAIVTGMGTYIKLMTIDQVETMMMFGSNATVLTGQLAQIDGIPVMVSEKYPETEANTGFNLASASDRTSLAIVYRDAFLRGMRRDVRIEIDKSIITQQWDMVSTMRMDSQLVYAKTTEAMVGLIYNLSTTAVS